MPITLDTGWELAKKCIEADYIAADRTAFLNDLITLFVEHGGYADWMVVRSWDDASPQQSVILSALEADGLTPSEIELLDWHTVDHKLLETALSRIRSLDEIPFLSAKVRSNIRRADLFNDAGLIDVIDGLAVVEIALFGEVRYA